ncbi:MAG: 16S rRNA (guanine(966)-N(2))-methyltransferase RsmD [bacterium]|nr:16S rRNA (guanine(966)-N(2))-methyltransferase RsmD [bacterium]
MQVIAGIAKGRKLKSLPGLSTRPILARIKKSLFDIIRLPVIEAAFLDLYAGTGSVGIEALSRGAKSAVFIEKDPNAIKVIRDNLQLTRFLNQGQVLQGNVFDLLQRLGQAYNVIFVGPPYKLGVTKDTIATIDKYQVLAEDGLVVAQHHYKEPMEINVGGLFMYRQERYGDTRLSFYRKANSE